MKRAKTMMTSLAACLLIVGTGLISSACNGQSPLGISLEEAENNLVHQPPLFPSDPSDPPPPPENGDE